MPDALPREGRAWCPFHSTLTNAQTFGPKHPCFTIYDQRPTDA